MNHDSSLFRSAMRASLVLALAPGTADIARSAEIRCPAADVVVNAAEPADATSACDGARDAIQFLGAQGLRVPDAIKVDIVAELPDVTNRTALGAYLHAERRAYIIPFAKFQARARHFELPADRALYRSLATHEVAHVVAAANFTVARPNVEAQEYIAYVTQLAAMPAELRERVLALPSAYVFDNHLQMHTAIYLSDPERFGVGAYRHFGRPENGTAFLRSVLAGRVLNFQPP